MNDMVTETRKTRDFAITNPKHTGPELATPAAASRLTGTVNYPV